MQLQIRNIYWRLKSRVLYQFLYEVLDLSCVLTTGIVLKVGSKGEWWIYNDIFVNGEYDSPILKALESSSRPHPFVVLDLGANVGYFGLRVIDLVQQRDSERLLDITMVEGSRQTYRKLEDR